MPPSPSHIVSLVPSTTETLFALGLADRIVGVTRYCERPRSLPPHVRRVGGTKNPDIAAIRDLKPDLVFVNTEENRPEDVKAIRSFAPVHESFPKTAAEGAAFVRDAGKATGTAAKAEEIARAIELELEGVSSLAKKNGSRRRAAYFIWKDPWMTINGDTFIHDVLERAGLENVFADHSVRYPETAYEEIARRAPEVIFLSSEPYPFKEKHRNELLAQEGIPAARLGRIYLVDGQHFCWHGVRQIEGLRWIRETLLK
ncbi:MAG: cobalamin-binding protein [Bdellovibrionota bacterium]